ncbi:class I adenylate cyclase [Candidatus Palibaumannia cicadellinicola]|uniref:class I adenylate cyclase n=1 Tax=Candidatus Palibaumannia cicadellinicola TaxID=186490 RepID=UPI00069D8440|nr:class I adenylate cyclase [Candidatus Baumannia cicadellinicola]
MKNNYYDENNKISSDILFDKINIIKQRCDTLNVLRINRALVTMKPNFQYVYSIVPTLLHCNHHLLPGYLDSTVPHGICLFTLEKHHKIFLYKILNTDSEFVNTNSEKPITSVYSMGSTSSIGQNNNSDIDIWVFYQSWLNNEERTKLHIKCALIKEWAATNKGVNLHLFILEENSFIENKDINSDSYLVINNIFVLEEFYRTAVHMSGKKIIWNIVPIEEEPNYDKYILSLYKNGIFSHQEWFDLGKIGTISINNYLYASRYQLHKSIYYPYKSVLKMLLLEAYSWEYPNPKLLAMHIKRLLHNNKKILYYFDPYCMLLDRITYYLYQINDLTRLDLVRRCFYLKVSEQLSTSLSSSSINWRRKIMMNLVKNWGWNFERVRMLDNYINVNRKNIEINEELLDAMIHSYHKLMFLIKKKQCT